MPLALRVENVSKQYRIYNRPSDRMLESLTRGRLAKHRVFWALRDIDFEVERGTTVGIIGPNGSGKSTLLQIITGTLNPTTGNVWQTGRTAALLELGAGFNPEFTGVENIFMNAALLGFTRRETERLLPEIERFAEIGEFLHQPVKTYSSGMYVRLGFSIAVSADPQILVIDEALAVGDTVFQYRCLRRIKQMQERGVTVLFVSHDPAAVRALCGRAILLNAGRMIADGKPADVLNRYQKIIMEREDDYEAKLSPVARSSNEAGNMIDTADDLPALLHYAYRHGDRSAEIIGAALLDESRRATEVIETGAPTFVRMRILFHRDVVEPVIGILVRNRHGIHAYGTNTEQQGVNFGEVRRGETIDVTFAFQCWLGIDGYSISLAAHSSSLYQDGVSFDWLDGALFFRVVGDVVTEGVANLNASATVRRTYRGDDSEKALEASECYG